MYFKGQILPNLMLLAFDESGIWPNSPKQWIDQLEKCDNDKVKKIIESHDNDIVFNEICSSEERKNFYRFRSCKER